MGPEDSASVRRRYAREVAVLHAIAAASLKQAENDPDFVWRLQALMAFEDGGTWQRHLEYLDNGEAPFDCPSCSEHLLVDLDAQEPSVESFGDGSLAATTVTPKAAPAATVEGRLLGLARAAGLS